MDPKLIEALKALAADWRTRDYNPPYSFRSQEDFARGEGKTEAFQEAADELISVLKTFGVS